MLGPYLCIVKLEITFPEEVEMNWKGFGAKKWLQEEDHIILAQGGTLPETKKGPGIWAS